MQSQEQCLVRVDRTIAHSATQYRALPTLEPGGTHRSNLVRQVDRTPGCNPVRELLPDPGKCLAIETQSLPGVAPTAPRREVSHTHPVGLLVGGPHKT